jgi:hypothetical protein
MLIAPPLLAHGTKAWQPKELNQMAMVNQQLSNTSLFLWCDFISNGITSHLFIHKQD